MEEGMEMNPDLEKILESSQEMPNTIASRRHDDMMMSKMILL